MWKAAHNFKGFMGTHRVHSDGKEIFMYLLFCPESKTKEEKKESQLNFTAQLQHLHLFDCLDCLNVCECMLGGGYNLFMCGFITAALRHQHKQGTDLDSD